MLIDSNAYIGHWPFRRLKYNTLEALKDRMKEFGTDASVISNLNGVFYKNTQHANDELYQMIRSKKAYQNKFIPFAVINPIYGGWRDDFQKCTTEMGMKGVRLYPKYHLYNITNPYCIELVKMCRDRGLPVVFSLRIVDSRPSSWIDIENTWKLEDVVPIVRAVPDAKYLIYNVSRGINLNEEDTDLFKKADLLIDSSGSGMRDWPYLLTKYGSERICFGTHSPIFDYSTGLLRIESLRDSEADETTKEMLRSGNIRKMLQI